MSEERSHPLYNEIASVFNTNMFVYCTEGVSVGCTVGLYADVAVCTQCVCLVYRRPPCQPGYVQVSLEGVLVPAYLYTHIWLIMRCVCVCVEMWPPFQSMQGFLC